MNKSGHDNAVRYLEMHDVTVSQIDGGILDGGIAVQFDLLTGVDELCAVIPEMENVVIVSLSACDVSDAGLLKLQPVRTIRRLRVASLRGPVTGKGLACVAGMPDLEELVCEVHSESRTAIDAIRQCRMLRQLVMNRSNLSDADVLRLTTLQHLRKFSISDCPISFGIRVIEQWPLIEELVLSDTQLSDDALPLLRQAHSLKSLYLNDTELTDEGFAALSGHPNLECLLVGNTRMTPAIVRHLRKIPRLESVMLANVTTARGWQSWVRLIRDFRNLRDFRSRLNQTDPLRGWLEELAQCSTWRHLTLVSSSLWSRQKRNLQQKLSEKLPKCYVSCL